MAGTSLHPQSSVRAYCTPLLAPYAPRARTLSARLRNFEFTAIGDTPVLSITRSTVSAMLINPDRGDPALFYGELDLSAWSFLCAAVILSGYCLTLLSYYNLHDDKGLYFGWELNLVLDSEDWMASFPYGTIPHPMISGGVLSWIGFHIYSHQASIDSNFTPGARSRERPAAGFRLSAPSTRTSRRSTSCSSGST